MHDTAEEFFAHLQQRLAENVRRVEIEAEEKARLCVQEGEEAQAEYRKQLYSSDSEPDSLDSNPEDDLYDDDETSVLNSGTQESGESEPQPVQTAQGAISDDASQIYDDEESLF